jgi:hypothetical protein
MTKEEWDAIGCYVANQMANHVNDYIASISLEVSSNEGKLLGSGIYLQLCGQPYLITNEHVAREGQNGNLGHSLTRGDYIHRINNPFQCIKEPIDTAITRIDKDHFVKGEQKAVPSFRVKTKFEPAQHDLLFILGFPGEKSRMSALAQGLISGAVPYLTQEAPLSEDNNFDSKYYFAIHYPYDTPLLTTENKRETLFDAHGFSGTAVWDTGYVETQGQNWKPENATIVGLIRGWDQKNHVLIAVKIEFIREFIIYALRQEAAYFNWRGRGQPCSDDWADWFWAEENIKDLT